MLITKLLHRSIMVMKSDQNKFFNLSDRFWFNSSVNKYEHLQSSQMFTNFVQTGDGSVWRVWRHNPVCRVHCQEHCSLQDEEWVRHFWRKKKAVVIISNPIFGKRLVDRYFSKGMNWALLPRPTSRGETLQITSGLSTSMLLCGKW